MSNDDAQRLGAGIRARRKQLAMTIVELAERSALSHPFLSQVERGLARPSLDSLGRIAHALGTSQIELWSGTALDAERPGVQRNEARTATGVYGLEQARILVHGDTRFTPIDVRGDHRERGEYFVHDEDEFALVIEGRVDIDLGPEGVFTLGPDESLYFPGGTPHRWGSADGGAYRMVVVKERRATTAPPTTAPTRGGEGAAGGTGKAPRRGGRA